MTTELALTPAASAAAAATAIRVEVRNIQVTGPDIQSLLSSVQVDMELVPEMDVDSDDMAMELMQMIGRLSTVSTAIEAERKERTAPLLAAQKWLMDGYSPARIQIDGLIVTGKNKLIAYNRAIAEKKRLEEEAAAKKRQEEAAAAAKAEADALAASRLAAQEAAALREAGSEQVADAMETKAMVAVDTARQTAATAVQALYTGPARSVATAPLRGTGGRWSAEVTNKADLIKHVAALLAQGDMSLVTLLDVNEKNINAMAKLQMANLRVPGLKPVFTESIAIRKQAVPA